MSEDVDRDYELQRASISLISAVAQADEVIHPNELKLLAEMLNKEWGIIEIAATPMADEVLKQEIAEDDIVFHCNTFSEFLSKDDKISFLNTLVKVANADKELHEKEKECIVFIAEKMEVSPGELSDLPT